MFPQFGFYKTLGMVFRDGRLDRRINEETPNDRDR